MELLDVSLVNWSRGQFALTAMYHWIFVPLTLGVGVVMAIMETLYYKTGKEVWKKATKFWMTLFGVNFACGVATGIILEFQFGTNWSNYSWFVGDIFGAPLAIEGMLAFFLEATFISIMFFGWNKVSKGFHLASTWLVMLGATFSALWILVANAWMQYPVGMEFNPDTARNEMIDFWGILLSPVALNKFFHTVLSGWVLGALFVVGVSAWFILKKRELDFALRSIKIGAIFGVVSSILIIATGDGSAYHVAQKQPMKLAAMEGLYEGKEGANIVAMGLLNPEKQYDNDEEIFIVKMDVPIPKLLSLLGYRDGDAFVPGIKDIIEGYTLSDGTRVPSFAEKQASGKKAIQALSDYRKAKAVGNDSLAVAHKTVLDENFSNFGYGYLEKPADLIPNVALVFYSFHIMVALGMLFLVIFMAVWFFHWKKKLENVRWLLWISLFSIPLGYLATQLGWVVAEVGRQPWAIQDVLPVQAAASSVSTGSVQLTFFLFLALFTALLIAEIRIMVKQIQKGPGSE
ncbi:MAG: cytochrome ubiquinol oxidase subunit I [Paludibacter sp.]|nr:cytochrome ubiquinol oxidase subunit I [Paludibacter sp.]MDD4198727.1 cytochrome ubiquinol oxidase subunit I [Paludibacter sp.]MDD4428426.1 cytochrome ubiquinol oxidase subunit I [Paludibacter sp.]